MLITVYQNFLFVCLNKRMIIKLDKRWLHSICQKCEIEKAKTFSLASLAFFWSSLGDAASWLGAETCLKQTTKYR